LHEKEQKIYLNDGLIADKVKLGIKQYYGA